MFLKKIQKKNFKKKYHNFLFFIQKKISEKYIKKNQTISFFCFLECDFNGEFAIGQYSPKSPGLGIRSFRSRRARFNGIVGPN
jgi:hypothetical protein